MISEFSTRDSISRGGWDTYTHAQINLVPSEIQVGQQGLNMQDRKNAARRNKSKRRLFGKTNPNSHTVC